MRVAVVLSKTRAQNGGAATFESTVVTALRGAFKKRGHMLLTLSIDQDSDMDSEVIEEDGTLHATFFGDHQSSKSMKSPFIPQIVQRAIGRMRRTLMPRLEKVSLESRIADWGAKNTIDLIYSPGLIVPCQRHPYFVTVWDLQHRRQPYFPEVSSSGWDWESRERHYRNILPRAAGIITGTSVGCLEVVQYYGVEKERVSVIPLPTPDDVMEPRTNTSLDCGQPSSRKPFALYPAQFWPHKNHATLLKVWRNLKQLSGFRLHLVLCGADHGNQAYIAREIEANGLSDLVHISGFVSREQLLQMYRDAEMLIFPSLFGPDNLPPLEAMALGCPTIAARVAGSDEQLLDGAILVEGTSICEYVDAILSLQNDTLLRDRLVRRGAAIALERRAESYGAKLVDVFERFSSIRDCWCRSRTYSNVGVK